jgi:hypothetical protein
LKRFEDSPHALQSLTGWSWILTSLLSQHGIRWGKRFVPEQSAIGTHVPEYAMRGMYIHSQICYVAHWTTSFVVFLCVMLLYTTVVRFSYNQGAESVLLEAGAI